MSEPDMKESRATPKSERTLARDRVLNAPELSNDLNRRIASSGVITISTQVAKLVIRLGSGAIMARLLSPSDFGLLALVTVMTGFLELFKDAGLSMATIQRKDLTHEQISTLFWINVGLGATIMLLQMVSAPLIAWVYDEPRLSAITIYLACLTLVTSTSLQHQALLRRNMRFGVIAAIDVASLLVGVGVGVWMAFQGSGYWSLVGMNAGTAFATALLSFGFSGWRPGRPSRAKGVKDMLKFGGNLASANFFNYLTRHSDNFVIGYLQGPAALGIYSRGHSIFLVPLQQFLAPISAVVIPALARTADKPDQFRQIVLEKSYFVLFFVVLATGCSFCLAPEMVAILLGEQWMEAVPIVRFLAVGGAIYGTNIAGSWVASTQGNAYRQLRVALVAGPIYATAYFIGAYLYGALGVACAFSITCVLLRYPVFRYLLEGSPIAPKELIIPLLTVGAYTSIATACAIGSIYFLPEATLAQSLALKLGVFTVIVSLFCAFRLLRLPRISLKG